MPYVQDQLQITLQLCNKTKNQVQSSASTVRNFMIKTHVFCVPKNRYKLLNDIVILKTLVGRTNWVHRIFKLHWFQ